MSCELNPLPPPPVLPAPYSIDPPALPPLPDSSIGFCCRQVGFTVPALLPPFPPGVSAAFATAITEMLTAVEDYIDALPIACPKE